MGHQEHQLDEITHLLHLVLRRLDRLLNLETKDNRVVKAILYQEYNPMANGTILGVVPGATGTFTAVPVNAAGLPVQLPLPTVPVWTSSDTVNAPVVSSADGLTATVAVPSSFVPAGGASFTLTWTMADGTASSTATVPYDAVPVDNKVVGANISQIS